MWLFTFLKQKLNGKYRNSIFNRVMMENLIRVIQDPRPLFWMQSTCSKGGMRRNRCSFVKVGPSESRNTFGNEVNTQFLATILPIHSVGFHGGPSTLRPGGTYISQSCHHGNDKKNQLVDVTHNFLFRVQIKNKRGPNNKNARAWITDCLRKKA